MMWHEWPTGLHRLQELRAPSWRDHVLAWSSQVHLAKPLLAPAIPLVLFPTSPVGDVDCHPRPPEAMSAEFHCSRQEIQSDFRTLETAARHGEPRLLRRAHASLVVHRGTRSFAGSFSLKRQEVRRAQPWSSIHSGSRPRPESIKGLWTDVHSLLDGWSMFTHSVWTESGQYSSRTLFLAANFTVRSTRRRLPPNNMDVIPLRWFTAISKEFNELRQNVLGLSQLPLTQPTRETLPAMEVSCLSAL